MMEIIRINFEKVKISLSHNDMQTLEINCDMLDGMNKKGRIAFDKILEEAKGKCGFNTCGNKLFVQLFPSKDGGCDMFITKLENTNEKRYTVTKKKSSYCYQFKNINDLIMFCKAIIHIYPFELNSLYINEDKKTYYICLDKDIHNITEYNGKKCVAEADAYIKEHYRLITDNAVSILSNI